MFTSGTQKLQQGTWIAETGISKHQKHFATREEAREWSGSLGRQYEARRTTTSDPEPYVHEDGKRYARSRVVIGGFTRAGFFDPRPEYAVLDNPILLAFREHYNEFRPENAQAWLDDIADRDGYGWDAYINEPTGPDTIEMRVHAYDVLTRLASLA